MSFILIILISLFLIDLMADDPNVRCECLA
jgi:hypothetical protein